VNARGVAVRWVLESVALGTLVGCAAAPLPPGADGRVTRIVDGDTLRVGVERVRLIGIDAPEAHGAVECHGREATRALAALLPVGTPVRLAYDVERRDRYGRTLAYVYRRQDRLFVNARLVTDGHAVPFTVPPNVAHAAEFRRLATAARRREHGLWDTCRPDPRIR
jgi:micrococcal nuclease